MDRGAWQATVYGIAKRWTRLSHQHFLLLSGGLNNIYFTQSGGEEVLADWCLIRALFLVCRCPPFCSILHSVKRGTLTSFSFYKESYHEGLYPH